MTRQLHQTGDSHDEGLLADIRLYRLQVIRSKKPVIKTPILKFSPASFLVPTTHLDQIYDPVLHTNLELRFLQTEGPFSVCASTDQIYDPVLRNNLGLRFLQTEGTSVSACKYRPNS